MKRFIILSTLFLFCLAINAQEVKLTIETAAGGLKDAMTQEQRQTVTNLTLTGSMNDSDFYLIRDEMRNLHSINIKEVKVDTIPSKAFFESYPLSSVVLPKELKSIGDSAFYTFLNDIVFTGDFPKIGKRVFLESYPINYQVSEDNVFCKVIDQCIYSWDEKTLFLVCKQPYSDFISISEKTEIIASRSFEGCCLRDLLIIPQSVKYIKSDAFNCITTLMPACSYNDDQCHINFYCKALIPPILEDIVFNNKNIGNCILYVTDECLDLYKSLPQWNKFASIKSYTDYTDPPPGGGNISSDSKHPLSVTKANGQWVISGENIIKSIEIMTSTGVVLYSKECGDTQIQFPVSENRNVNYVKVRFADDTFNVVKIMN